uniref:Hint domain-containing protein n=1 Tax=Panagrolaimus sp. ES5 TaxID=591445 RepID=A0AC34F5A8_9BILA
MNFNLCDYDFISNKCAGKGEWVAGINPLKAQNDLNITCCYNEVLQSATLLKTYNIGKGQMVKGGEIRVNRKLLGFLYISNIMKIFNKDQSVYFKVFVNQLTCNKIHVKAAKIFTNHKLKPLGESKKIPVDEIEDEDDETSQVEFNVCDIERIPSEEVTTPEPMSTTERIPFDNSFNEDAEDTEVEFGGECFSEQGDGEGDGDGEGEGDGTGQTQSPNANPAPVQAPSAGTGSAGSGGAGSGGAGSGGAGSGGAGSGGAGSGGAGSGGAGSGGAGSGGAGSGGAGSGSAGSGGAGSGGAGSGGAGSGGAGSGGAGSGGAGSGGGGGAGAGGINPSSPAAGAGSCFSADTMVKVLNGKRKRMDEIKIGEWISSAGNGKVGFNKVVSWLHRMPDLESEFLKFTLENGKTLKITKKHLIYKVDCDGM